MTNIIDKLKKGGSSKYTSILTESKFFNDKDNIRTRVPLINVALSGKLDGGLTSGLTVLAGPSKHFKTNMGLIMVSAYLKKYPEAVCLFYDSEYGATPAYLRQMGVDPERVVHTPIKHVEELKFDVAKQLDQLERGDKVIILIDSIGNLASKKELEDAQNEKSVADMSRAKQLKSLFRIITPYLTHVDIPCIAINHTYETQEMFSKTVMSGGCVIKDTMITMEDGSTKVVQDIIPGDKVKTLIGSSEVTHSWSPETLDEGTPECIKITFEDNHSVTCSESHQFMVMRKDIPTWVTAKELSQGDDVVSV